MIVETLREAQATVDLLDPAMVGIVYSFQPIFGTERHYALFQKWEQVDVYANPYVKDIKVAYTRERGWIDEG